MIVIHGIEFGFTATLTADRYTQYECERCGWLFAPNAMKSDEVERRLVFHADRCAAAEQGEPK